MFINENLVNQFKQYLKNKNPRLYKRFKKSISGISNSSRIITVAGYKISRKIYKFN